MQRLNSSKRRTFRDSLPLPTSRTFRSCSRFAPLAAPPNHLLAGAEHRCSTTPPRPWTGQTRSPWRTWTAACAPSVPSSPSASGPLRCPSPSPPGLCRLPARQRLLAAASSCSAWRGEKDEAAGPIGGGGGRRGVQPPDLTRVAAEPRVRCGDARIASRRRESEHWRVGFGVGGEG